MKQISLIRFSFDRKTLGISLAKANKFYRTLYGYNNLSYYGKYQYWINGFIDEIDAKKISSSTLMVPLDNLDVLVKFLEENGAKVEVIVDELSIEEEKYERVISMGKVLQTPK